MAKHKALKDAIREKAIREQLAQSLKEQYQRGLLVGSKAMLKVIGDKIADTKLSAEERLADIMKFINKMLKMTEKTEVTNADPKEQLDSVIGAEEDETEKDEKSNVVELPVPVEGTVE